MKLLEAIAGTWRELVSDFDVLSLMVLAALAYGFYYPAPYAHQHPVGVRLAVVDEEHSALTRALIDRIDASEKVDITARPATMSEAKAALLERDVDGILLFPRGLTQAALRGQPSGVAIWVNGTHLTKANGIGSAIQDAIRDEISLRVRALGQQQRIPLPASVTVQPMFNTDQGYLTYIFPAVTPVILQQTMLFGAAVMLARRRMRSGRAFRSAIHLAGTWLALFVVSAVLCALYLGAFFSLQDTPHHATAVQSALICICLGMAIAALGVAVGPLFRHSNDALCSWCRHRW